MLKNIRLENFRGFYNHEIPFNKKVNIVVGRNNAGKSTFVEALRIITLVVNRYHNAIYHSVPIWLHDIPKGYKGISPSMKSIGINFHTIFYHYANAPSIITAQFEDNSSITIYLGGEDKIFGVIKDSNGQIIKNRSQAKSLNLDVINILPQVTPVQKNESVLTPDYIKNNLSSSLASSHFRNQLNLFYELFQNFKEYVENTWRGVSIDGLDRGDNLPGNPLFLYVRNDDFVAEISEMGHGLQIWFQIIWFLARSPESSIVIFDEPDVYLHPDLQRKLIRFLRNKYSQIIITTHSVEILSEVEPSEILVIDRKNTKSSYANTFPVVQGLIENIGSGQNIHMARLWNARRLILVEGKDINLLKQFHNTLFSESQEAFDAIPNMSLGGWGGWNYAIGSSMLLKNSLEETISTYCIFDSDYHSLDVRSKRQKEAKEKGIHLHIWTQKELENYLIVPATLQRFIQKRIAKRKTAPKLQEIVDKIKHLSLEMEDNVLDAISNEMLAQNKTLGVSKTNKEARKRISEVKDNTGGIISLISGKDLISRLSGWSQQEFSVCFSPIAIAKEMIANEIPQEIKMVISAIEKCEPFI